LEPGLNEPIHSNEERRRRMKYMLICEGPMARGELSPRVPELNKKTADLLKDEKKYGKVIMPPHYYGSGKIVAIVECDSARQLANRMNLYAPSVIYKEVHPLIPAEDWSAAGQEHQELQVARLKSIVKG
jgi:hypothetical protein